MHLQQLSVQSCLRNLTKDHVAEGEQNGEREYLNGNRENQQRKNIEEHRCGRTRDKPNWVREKVARVVEEEKLPGRNV